jgi:hypothetical protein
MFGRGRKTEADVERQAERETRQRIAALQKAGDPESLGMAEELDRELDEDIVRRTRRDVALAEAAGTAPQPSTVEMREYGSAAEFERDAAWRTGAGWQIQGQTQAPSRAKVGTKMVDATIAGAVFGGPVGLASLLVPNRKRGKITVIWVRSRPMPAGPARTAPPLD